MKRNIECERERLLAARHSAQLGQITNGFVEKISIVPYAKLKILLIFTHLYIASAAVNLLFVFDSELNDEGLPFVREGFK